VKKRIRSIALALLVTASLGIMGCPPPPEVAPLPAPPEVFELRMQTTWPAGSVLHASAIELARTIEEMSGGRLRIDVYPAGAIVPAFEVLTAVHKGILDAGHSWSAFWIGLHPAFNLFSSVAGGPFGMDTIDYAGWLLVGGGLELYRQLFTDVLGLNVLVFPADILPPEPLGWFKKPVLSWEDLDGLKFRAAGLTAEVMKEAGMIVVTLPAGEILPALEKGLIDGAEFMCPTTDMDLGLMDVAKYYHAPGVHRDTGTLELLINKDSWNRLPPDLQAIIEVATRAHMLHHWLELLHSNLTDLELLKTEHGVTLVRTCQEILLKILEAWDALAAKYAAECPFFAEVHNSQREFARRMIAFRRVFYLPYEFRAEYYWPTE